MYSDMKLTAKDAADTKAQANSMSPRAESNGRRPGPGFGQKSGKRIEIGFCLPEQSWEYVSICTRQVVDAALAQAAPINVWSASAMPGGKGKMAGACAIIYDFRV